MQQKTLLTHLLDKEFIPPYENVANSGICYLLDQYPEAREALKNMLEMDEVPENYFVNLSTDSGGLPDVTGVDDHGNKTVMIEGKFWAMLTDRQPDDYLKNLNGGGKLLFLCPRDRVKSLGEEVREKASDDAGKIVVRDWIEILTLMEAESEKSNNVNMTSDLIQLKAFCQKLGMEIMRPLTDADRDPIKKEPPPQIEYYLKRCQGILKNENGLADFSRGTTWASSKNGRDYFGFYFYVGKRLECFVHFSREKWTAPDKLIWLNVKWDRCEPKADQKRIGNKKLKEALKILYQKNADKHDVSIMLKSDVDEEEIVKHIVDSVNKILTDIKEKFPND